MFYVEKASLEITEAQFWAPKVWNIYTKDSSPIHERYLNLACNPLYWV